MPKFRKRPVIVDAHVWCRNGDHPDDNVWRPFEDTGVVPTEPREGAVVRRYRNPRVPGNDHCAYCRRFFYDHGWIDTSEGGHVVCPGDWVITGVKGERYPCKPDVFALTYEAVVEPGQACDVCGGKGYVTMAYPPCRVVREPCGQCQCD